MWATAETGSRYRVVYTARLRGREHLARASFMEKTLQPRPRHSRVEALMLPLTSAWASVSLQEYSAYNLYSYPLLVLPTLCRLESSPIRPP